MGPVSNGSVSYPEVEAFQRLRVLSYIRGKEFEGYESPEFRVFGLVDDTHAAAKLLDDSVMRDGLANHALQWGKREGSW